MSPETRQDETGAASMRSVMPPHVVLHDFLEEDTVAGLLDFALAHESRFSPTRTGRTDRHAVRPTIRVSVNTRDIGPFEPLLTGRILDILPDLTARLGLSPVTTPSVELELVAHNDGAFYRRHIDTQTADTTRHIRLLSCVYYFHARPTAFTGGALRLYAIGDPAFATFVDIAPERNSLLAFPSWAPHEVMPVSCPSGRFADSRFAINCWVQRPRAPAM